VVFVVDDDVSVRESLEALIRCQGWRPEVFQSAEEFLARPRLIGPSCLILDVTLPDLNGLELQKRIVDRADMPIIFNHGLWRRADDGGGNEGGGGRILDEAICPRGFVECHSARPRTQRRCTESRGRAAGAPGPFTRRSDRREREVMTLVVCGRLNKQVGAELGISEITVKAHRGRAMQKMKAGSLADLVNIAAKLRVTFAP